jgi:hypothetical protein
MCSKLPAWAYLTPFPISAHLSVLANPSLPGVEEKHLQLLQDRSSRLSNLA